MAGETKIEVTTSPFTESGSVLKTMVTGEQIMETRTVLENYRRRSDDFEMLETSYNLRSGPGRFAKRRAFAKFAGGVPSFRKLAQFSKSDQPYRQNCKTLLIPQKTRPRLSGLAGGRRRR